MNIFEKEYKNSSASLNKDGYTENIFSRNGSAEKVPNINNEEPVMMMQGEDVAGRFREYVNGMKAYKTDSAIRKDLQLRLNRFKRKQKNYEEAWEASVDHARASWQSNQSLAEKSASTQREAMKKRAESEKVERIRMIEKLEEELSYNLSKKEEEIREAEELEKKCKAEISRLERYEVEGIDCDSEAEIRIIQAFQNGYFSEKQRALAEESPQQFCSVWAKTPQELKALEEKLWDTGFLYDLSTVLSNETVYRRFVRIAGLIAGGICFLLITLNQLSQNVVFNVFGMVASFLAAAGEMYLTAAIVAKKFKKHKDVAVHNSKSGTIATVLAIIIGIIMTESMYSVAQVWRGVDWGVGLAFALMGGLMVGFFLSQAFMRELLMSKSSFIRGQAYKTLFRNAEKTVNQRRQNNNAPILKDGEMDAIIVSYVHHHEYLQYLSINTRDRLISEAQIKLAESERLHMLLMDDRDGILNQQKQLKSRHSEVLRQNQETDRKLEKDLSEFNRKHGIKVVPDFSLRENLLDKDRKVLDSAEREFGIPSDYTRDQKTAIQACRDIIENLARSLQQAVEKENEDIHIIEAWTDSGILPPFDNGDQKEEKYNYRLEPSVCLFNRSGAGDQKVTIIDHQYRPINFIYGDDEWIPGDEKSTENAAMLVGLIWQGFSRIAHPDLLNFYIVDDTGRLQFSFPGRLRQEIPEFQHQSGMTEVLDQKNVQNEFRPLKGLYTDRDINELTESIYSKYQSIDDYRRVNRKEVADAEAQIGAVDDITVVNYCMRHGKTNTVTPYDIVIFVVPDGEENRNTYQSMNMMYNMIQQGAAKNIGVIPVVLVSESGYNGKWSGFVNYVRKSGITCRVDLRTLRLQQEGGKE